MGKGIIIPLPEGAPHVGEVYKHYKGDSYEVVGVALNSGESGEGKDDWLVVYKPLYNQAAAPLFARPFAEWRQSVEWQGKQVKRFVKI